MKLLQFCDKYEVIHFKEACIKFLKSKLTLANCLELVILANRCQAPDLQECATKTIMKGGKDIRQGDLWNQIKHDFPDIIEELIDKLQNLPCQSRHCTCCGQTHKIQHYCADFEEQF